MGKCLKCERLSSKSCRILHGAPELLPPRPAIRDGRHEARDGDAGAADLGDGGRGPRPGHGPPDKEARCAPGGEVPGGHLPLGAHGGARQSQRGHRAVPQQCQEIKSSLDHDQEKRLGGRDHVPLLANETTLVILNVDSCFLSPHAHFFLLSVYSNASFPCVFAGFCTVLKSLSMTSALKENGLWLWARKITRVSFAAAAPKTAIDEKGAAHAGARCTDGRREYENPVKIFNVTD